MEYLTVNTGTEQLALINRQKRRPPDAILRDAGFRADTQQRFF